MINLAATAHTGAQLAALTDGTAFKNWALLLVGNVFAAWLAIRAVGHFIKKEWGDLIQMVFAALAVGAFVWFPDGVKTVLGDLWTKISGNT
ncbi:hypothetical protein ACFWNL_35925 [Kitasatospora sp. NPDC058397]|uniref:hypothetical protein n=1 Tax=unclassified Kitasatospora TaxID=2633591 RepID=UPI00366989AE